MNGTINLKKLSTKMLDAISTLNTKVDAVPSQIKTNNRQMLATVEQNAEASSRAYATGQYLAVNGKLYRALNDIAQGTALQENVNIEWILLGDEVSKIRRNLKAGAYSEVINDWNRQTEGGVLDARLGPTIKTKMNQVDTQAIRINKIIETHQGRMYASGYNEHIKQGSYYDLASITIPAGDTKVWLVLAQTDSNVGPATTYLAQLVTTPNDNTYMYASKSYCAGGGGTVTWGFINPSPNNIARKITLRCYGYYQNEHRESGRIYAFAFANTNYG